jgi:DNA-binding LacI/PurR family transcriptional regulator
VFVTGSQTRESYYNYGPYVRTERAFRATAERLHIAPVVVTAGQDASSGRGLARQLLADHPDTTALVMLNEFAAIGLLTGLQHHGVTVPDDISIIALLTSDEMASFAEPRLTIMRSPGTALGQLAVDHLVRQMTRGERPAPVLLPSTLVPGESTAPPPPIPYGRR